MFETELFICMKMDLALITYNNWCAIKPNQTKPNQTLLHSQVFYNLSKISQTIWLQYCDQLCLHHFHNKCFALFPRHLKSHMEWNDAHIKAPTITILPTTAGTIHSWLNWCLIELLVIHNYNWNHLIMCKQISNIE